MVKPTEPADSSPAEETAIDPDGDPDNLHPRDTLDDEPYEGDPDADPGNLNPHP